MVSNIVNGNFGLVKSWRKSPRPIGASVLLVPFGPTPSHILGRNIQNFIKAFSWDFSLSLFMRVLIRNEMVCMWVLDTHYSLLGNWLRDYTSWALSGIGVKIKSLPKNFWSLVLNFSTPRYAFLFSNSETYIVHVINCEWSRSINFSVAYVLYVMQTCIFQHS